MCGHFGYITKEPTKEYLKRKKYFTQMLVWDTVRGEDSTGIFLKDHEGNEWTYKRALDGYDFSRLSVVRSGLVRHECAVAMGHNRAATRGTVTANNAHPFEQGNIVMTHNGTLTNFYNMKGSRDFTVDSEWLCWAINEFGIDEVAEMATGAFALAYYDKSTDKFYLMTNGERTLSFAIAKDDSTMYYASEGDMLSAMCFRNDISLKDNSWLACDKGVLYEFDVNNPSEWSSRELKLKTYAPPVTHSSFPRTQKALTGKKRTFRSVIDSIGMHLGQSLSLAFLDSDEEKLSIDFLILKPEDAYAEHPNITVRYVCKSSEEFYFILNSADKVINAFVQAGLEDIASKEVHVYIRTPKPSEESLPEDIYDDAPFTNMIVGPGRILIPVGEFKALCSDGCWQCKEDISEKDAEEVHWTTPMKGAQPEPICPKCVEDWQEYVSQI